MKINSIQNTNFRGLFVDKTKENNGKWKMEYYPYSWETAKINSETYDAKVTEMAKKEKIDITAAKLPWNEEIYVAETSRSPRISKDILGTVSYYEYPQDIMMGEFRKKIDEKEPMNLEESLKVSVQKHKIFKEMKNEEMSKIAEKISSDKAELMKLFDKYFQYSYEQEKLFSFLSDARSNMDSTIGDLKSKLFWAYDNINKYVKIASSLKELDKYIQFQESELEKIAEKKKTGDIIDISIRHQHDPNKPLYDAVNKLIKKPEELRTTNKLVLLAHKTIPLKKMIDEWYTGYGISWVGLTKQMLKEFPEGLTHYADRLISIRK